MRLTDLDLTTDTGPILAQSKTKIAPEDNSQTLHDRLAGIGARLLLETIPGFLNGEITPHPQPEGATYARKIEKSDGCIDWNEPAEIIGRKLRAFHPWPGAFAAFEHGGLKRLLKLWQAEPRAETGPPGTVLTADKTGLLVACGQGSLLLTEVQPEGRRRMTVQDFLSGHPTPRAFTARSPEGAPSARPSAAESPGPS